VHGRQVLALAAACAALGLLLALAAPRAAAAQGEGAGDRSLAAPVDVLILLGPATDWAARVRGQLSDLPVRARSEAVPESEQSASRSSAFARRQGAKVTVWLATDGDPAAPEGRAGAYVAIWLAESRALYTRRIAADWRALSAADRSAALEIAALGVRSAVRSLLLDTASAAPAATLGGDPAPERDATLSTERDATLSTERDATLSTERDTTLSTERDTTLSTERDATLVPPADATPTSASTRDASVAERPAASTSDAAIAEPDAAPSLALGSMLPTGLELEAGGAWQLSGGGTSGIGGLQAGVRVVWASWAFEVLGQYGLPAAARLGPARLELVRHALLAEAHYFAWERGAWRLSPLLRAGVTSLRRRSQGSDDPALRPLEAARYDFPTFGLGAIVSVALNARLSVSLRSALNVETGAPAFAVQTVAGASAYESRLWAVQPSLELGASWHF
jgi:hypothetical protein